MGLLRSQPQNLQLVLTDQGNLNPKALTQKHSEPSVHAFSRSMSP